MVSTDGTGNQRSENEAPSRMEGHQAPSGLIGINRRDWIRVAMGGSVGPEAQPLAPLPVPNPATHPEP
jgi:hypothetical protein